MAKFTMLHTYNRPPHLLLVAGHTYDLSKEQQDRIKKDLSAQKVPGPYFQEVKEKPATPAEILIDAKLRRKQLADQLAGSQKTADEFKNVKPEELEAPGKVNRLYRKATLTVDLLTVELEEMDAQIAELEQAAKSKKK